MSDDKLDGKTGKSRRMRYPSTIQLPKFSSPVHPSISHHVSYYALKDMMYVYLK